MRDLLRDSFRKRKKISVINNKSYLEEFIVEFTVKYSRIFSVR